MKVRRKDGDELLIAQYVEAGERIRIAIARGDNERTIMRIVQDQIQQLENLTKEYLEDELTKHFFDGDDDAVEELERKIATVDKSFEGAQREVLVQVLNQSGESFSRALNDTLRSIDAELAKSVQDRTLATVLEGQARGASRIDTAQRLEGVIRESGLATVRAGNGRTLTLENYTRTLVRTVTAQAYNSGAVTRYLKNGLEYGEVIESGEKLDAACSFMDGKHVLLTNRQLTPIYHPNCAGTIAPLLPEEVKDPFETLDDPRIPIAARQIMARS